MPEITRLYKGLYDEFEVEVVFGTAEDISPREAHTFEEFIFVAQGEIILTRSDKQAPERYGASSFIHLPAGVEHVIDARETPTRLVIIHPDK
ncbi:cupin domain-containing protein [Desulfobacter sp.]|uniref:cupin domain-containing protein n=1 Tax=Desulfobacter sp. TaxID=2294 RepID=UPI003D119E29